MASQTSFAPVESGDELSDSYRIVTAVRIRPLSEEEIQSNTDIIASTPAPGEIVLTDTTVVMALAVFSLVWYYLQSILSNVSYHYLSMVKLY